MNLPKAIEILEVFRDEGEKDLPLDVDPALTLLIEAGKRVEDMRTSPCTTADEILPGED